MLDDMAQHPQDGPLFQRAGDKGGVQRFKLVEGKENRFALIVGNHHADLG